MAGVRENDRGAGPRDARSAALANYLRQSASAFSMSADVTETARTAEAGMALLDAALVAESMPADDPRIRILSEAGLFESMPHGEATFVEIPEVRTAILRSLVSEAEEGAAIIERLVTTAVALDESPSERPTPVTRRRASPAEPAQMLPLSVLSQRVRRARTAVHERRHEPGVSAGLTKARHDLVQALEHYTAALESRRLPVPHSLQLELRLHRQLFDS